MGCYQSRNLADLEAFRNQIKISNLPKNDKFSNEILKFESIFALWIIQAEERWQNLPKFSDKNKPESLTTSLKYNMSYTEVSSDLRNSMQLLNELVGESSTIQESIKSKLYKEAKTMFENALNEEEMKVCLYLKENEMKLNQELGLDI